jgi:hypothetical protein
MHFHRSIKIPFLGGDVAFSVLSSEDGAKHFRDIRKYSSYSRDGNKVHVEYTSAWGTTTQEMTLGYRHITFRGNGPLGVTFGGSWTHLSDSIHLEQTVWGVPRFARCLVQKRVDRALEDVLQVVISC